MKPGKKDERRLSRRDFVKGTTVGAGAAALVGLGPRQATPADASEHAQQEVRDCDIAVVGLGISGLVAALHATELGAKVVALDKAPPGDWIGGNFILSGQSAHVALKGLNNSLDTLVEAIEKATGGTAPADLARTYCTHAPRLYKWFQDHGIEIQQLGEGPSMILPLKKRPWSMGPWKEVNRPGGPYDFRKSGGYKAAKHLESLLEQAGATILYETAAHRFIIDEKGEVNGLVLKRPDGIHTLDSHNIILCTGGFPFNQEMVSRYIGPRAGSWVASGTPFNTGDGHRMALEVGAAMRNMNSFYATIEPLEALKDPGLRMSFSMWGSRGTHGIVVNERGERFVDESWGRHGISHVMAKETRLNIRFLIVFDRTVYEESKELLDGLSGFGVTIHQAGSVEELIEKTGVSPYLATTLKEYNQAIETGTVHELPVPKTAMVRTMSSPPYFGIWCMPGTPYTHGGPQINGNAEIVDLDGRVIPGLYGAGDIVSGNLSGGEENRFGSYCGGISGAIWGLLAAEHSRERTQKA